ncbi:lipoprotein insertase outer membrane protein LolB [Pseudidiomarina taiwanensis]|uniref:Outer-membrane lipoprotein LolB n=1 Tax=Pseudidiomarina taiwanensis TaxID=337250 RepID=A0A432ZNZ6_9GAMM|nr:lipoprotein insertase outer membrane protein LolB [Pseudidiomarina taiwanensis]RUO79620.1 outer membrane lipoprotein LolB [Pseudidiomarina taiwanensis]
MRTIVIAGLALFLVGCAVRPSTESIVAIDNNGGSITVDADTLAAIESQQQLLSGLTQWRMRGQIAVFNLVEDERQAVYLDWQSSPEQLEVRFTHPLQGTLARIIETPNFAELIDEDGNSYQAADASTLLAQYLNVNVPFSLFNDLLLGRRLTGMREQSYLISSHQAQTYGLLHRYTMRANGAEWDGLLRRYEWQGERVFLPQQLELSSQAWRIKLRVTDWDLRS